MRKIVTSQSAPAAVGPYSQAVFAGDTLYISGQLPIDPSTGRMPATVEEQTERSLRNIEAILREAGLGFGNVVKSTVLLTDIADFAAMNAVYARFYADADADTDADVDSDAGSSAGNGSASFPARVCYAVAALPLGARVEIETVAVR